jgi:hypothetical protein
MPVPVIAQSGAAVVVATTSDAPSPTARAGVLQQPAIPDLTAAPTQANFNALLAALRAAGVIAP